MLLPANVYSLLAVDPDVSWRNPGSWDRFHPICHPVCTLPDTQEPYQHLMYSLQYLPLPPNSRRHCPHMCWCQLKVPPEKCFAQFGTPMCISNHPKLSFGTLTLQCYMGGTSPKATNKLTAVFFGNNFNSQKTKNRAQVKGSLLESSTSALFSAWPNCAL